MGGILVGEGGRGRMGLDHGGLMGVVCVDDVVETVVFAFLLLV